MSSFAERSAAAFSSAAEFERCVALSCEDAISMQRQQTAPPAPPPPGQAGMARPELPEMALSETFVRAMHEALPGQLPANPTPEEWRRAQACAVHLVTLLRK
jgi:hypothetical protein